MIQTFATLLFLLMASAGVAVIAASLIDDWASMTRALGFGPSHDASPLPHGRVAGSRQPRAIRVVRRLADQRVAA